MWMFCYLRKSDMFSSFQRFLFSIVGKIYREIAFKTENIGVVERTPKICLFRVFL